MNPNRKIPKALPFMILFFGAFCVYRLMPGSPGAPPWTVQVQGPIMGTTYAVKVVGRNLSPADKAPIESVVTSAMNAVNAKMSTYLKTQNSRNSTRLSQSNHKNESGHTRSHSNGTGNQRN